VCCVVAGGIRASGIYHTVAMCCSVLQCVAVRCNVLLCVAMCCCALQCVAVRCNVLQRVAVRCSAVQCVAMCCSALQCVAVRCSVLQDAMRHSMLQCVGVCGVYGSVLECVAGVLVCVVSSLAAFALAV